MKIFKVRIDNNPGSWKQGEDHSVLVVANSSKEAIEKVKSGWGERYDHKNDAILYTPEKGSEYSPYISDRAEFSCYEITFEGYEVFIGLKDIRKEKLDRINESETAT